MDGSERAVRCPIEKRNQVFLGRNVHIFGCGDGVQRIGDGLGERLVPLPEHNAHLVEVHKLAAICSKI